MFTNMLSLNSGGNEQPSGASIGTFLGKSSGSNLSSSNYKGILDDPNNCIFVELGYKPTNVYISAFGFDRAAYIDSLFFGDTLYGSTYAASNYIKDGDYFLLYGYVAIKLVDNGFYATVDTYYFKDKEIIYAMS